MGNYGRGHLARSVRYLIVVALLLFWPLRALAAIDAHSEVAAALYAASATHDAAERLADARLRAGDAKLQARLTAAPQAYVAALSARDRAYAQEIAATPEGLAALARFNAGDEAGALAILDDVRRAAALPQGFAASTLFRLTGAQAQTWQCTRLSGGTQCAFEGEAVCDLQEKHSQESESCGS